MIVYTFQICHLISDAECPKHLMVSEYIDPELSRDKSRAHLNTLMARWMIKTFTIAGIENNNFSNNKKINFKALPKYLQDDLSDVLPKLNLRLTGLPEFARITPAIAMHHLEGVAAMHQAILKLYHVRESLVIAAQVVAIYGEIWLYGDKEGQLVLDALLTVIKDACICHIDTVYNFWRDFYGLDPLQPVANSYLAQVRLKQWDNRAPHFEYLAAANEFYSRMTISYKRILQKIDTIMVAAKTFDSDAETAKQKKQDLISHLYDYMAKMPHTNTAHFLAIKGLYTEIQLTQAIDISELQESNEPAIIPKVITLKKEQSKIYNCAKKLLSEPFESHPELRTDLTLMPRPALFHSPSQKDIYDGFLAPYHKTVNTWLIWFILGFEELSKEEVLKMRMAYTYFNTVMKMLYPPTGTFNSVELESEQVRNTEIVLVDQYLRNAMSLIDRSFNPKSKGIPMTDKSIELFNVTQVGEELEVTITPMFLQYASGLYAKQLTSLNTELAAQKVITKTQEQHLQEQSKLIASQHQESTKQQKLYHKLEKELNTRNDELAKEREIRINEQLVARQREIEQQQQLKEQQEIIALLRKKLEQKRGPSGKYRLWPTKSNGSFDPDSPSPARAY